MKRLVILLVAIAFSTLIHAQETSAEKEVWQQEEAYWRYVSSGDSKSFKTLWSDRFTGWPDDAPTVDGKTTEERLTHTWQLENGQWHIVGGMACYAPCDAPQSNAH